MIRHLADELLSRHNTKRELEKNGKNSAALFIQLIFWNSQLHSTFENPSSH